LRKMVAAGEFREDLYYRLGAFQIGIPCLKDRPADIPLLAELFLARSAEELGKHPLELAEDAIAALLAYPGPATCASLET